MKCLGTLMTEQEFAAELDRIVDEALRGFREEQDITDDDIALIHARLTAWRAGQLAMRTQMDRSP